MKHLDITDASCECIGIDGSVNCNCGNTYSADYALCWVADERNRQALEESNTDITENDDLKDKT